MFFTNFSNLNILRTTMFPDFTHRQEFYILENTTFRKLSLFHSSSEKTKTHIFLGPLKRANLSHWKPTSYSNS
jgi:hypothetical protein